MYLRKCRRNVGGERRTTGSYWRATGLSVVLVSVWLGELFTIEYDLLLYDVTSTYFEGDCAKNPQATRGYSRDHCGDCKRVCIALVVSKCGMPVGYEVCQYPPMLCRAAH